MTVEIGNWEGSSRKRNISFKTLKAEEEKSFKDSASHSLRLTHKQGSHEQVPALSVGEAAVTSGRSGSPTLLCGHLHVRPYGSEICLSGDS